MPNKQPTAKLTLEQIHFLVPRECRNLKYECPVCHLWHLTIKKETLEFSCKTPSCEGNEGHDKIVATMWAEVRRREVKPPKANEGPKGPGLTLEQYAQAKQLPRDWLTYLGFVFEIKDYHGWPAVLFPYDETKSMKWRWGMGSHDRRWEKGSKVCLYGQQQLKWLLNGLDEDDLRRKFCFIVEGESDTQTLLYAGYPVLGVSGAESWREEDATILQDKQLIMVIQEPGFAAENLVRKIAKSLPGKVL